MLLLSSKTAGERCSRSQGILLSKRQTTVARGEAGVARELAAAEAEAGGKEGEARVQGSRPPGGATERRLE